MRTEFQNALQKNKLMVTFVIMAFSLTNATRGLGIEALINHLVADVNIR